MAPLAMKASGDLQQMQWLLTSSPLRGVHSQVQTVRVVGGLWWTRALLRPMADGPLRYCGLLRALHRGCDVAQPFSCHFFSSRCLQLSCCAHRPHGLAGMKQLLQAAPREVGEGGSSLCFTFLPAWPMEPSSEGDPLGAELCHPGGQDDAGERKPFFLPVLCGSFLLIYLYFPLLHCCSIMTRVQSSPRAVSVCR